MSEHIVLRTTKSYGAYSAKPALLMCIGLSWASIGYGIETKIKRNSCGRYTDICDANLEHRKASEIGQIEFPFETLLHERWRSQSKPGQELQGPGYTPMQAFIRRGKLESGNLTAVIAGAVVIVGAIKNKSRRSKRSRL